MAPMQPLPTFLLYCAAPGKSRVFAQNIDNTAHNLIILRCQIGMDASRVWSRQQARRAWIEICLIIFNTGNCHFIRWQFFRFKKFCWLIVIVRMRWIYRPGGHEGRKDSMEYTNKMAMAGRIAAQKMNKKAFNFYARLSPFTLYEYDTPDGKRYSYRGVIGDMDGLTFLELERVFEELDRLLS